MNNKSLNEIELKQVREKVAEKGSGSRIEARLTLALKMKDYVFRLGQPLVQVRAFALRLLTVGKVRLEFPDYVERLALVHKSDLLSASEAEAKVNAYIESIAGEDIEASAMAMTQKIITIPPI
ncbi:MAG: hypothetical protein WCO60_01160 [Verrucomicrobiota bacterium]